MVFGAIEDGHEAVASVSGAGKGRREVRRDGPEDQLGQIMIDVINSACEFKSIFFIHS